MVSFVAILGDGLTVTCLTSMIYSSLLFTSSDNLVSNTSLKGQLPLKLFVANDLIMLKYCKILFGVT